MSTSWRIALLLPGILLVLQAGPIRAQDLDTGKTGKQLFATNCSACHRTPRGLVKQNRLSLSSFLREHYTSSQATASELAAYLLATDRGAPQAKQKTTAVRPPATDSEPPRTKRKPTAAQPQQPSRSLWDLFSGGGSEQPKATKRTKTAPHRVAGKPRPSADVPNR